jgi:hypothetical protein
MLAGLSCGLCFDTSEHFLGFMVPTGETECHVIATQIIDDRFPTTLTIVIQHYSTQCRLECHFGKYPLGINDTGKDGIQRLTAEWTLPVFV